MEPDAHQDEPQQNGVPEPEAPHHDKEPSKNHHKASSDPDAQALVVESLKSQIQDLYSQVTQLNNKLVKSYDRVSDLEDDLHIASSNLRQSSLKVSQLELERTQHLSALNTGILVEKSHVTAELTRLMEKATEEAAQRGQAEDARVAIEKDLDDLSASLFEQANIMVAEARYARSLSERKVEESEIALKGAEEAVALMQKQMQALEEERDQSRRSVQGMHISMGKGKWVEKATYGLSRSTKLLSSHLPYQEFLLFVAHLRAVHPSSSQAPAMSTLLPLPFLARLVAEDSDPTLRLDLAPSLNWLSRRSVMAAIHTGQLTIEPVSPSVIFQEAALSSTSPTIPGLNSSGNNVACALCGSPIFPTPGDPLRSPSLSQTGSSWSSTLFKRPSISSSISSNTLPTSPVKVPPPTEYPSQIYIFRLSSPTSPTMSSMAIPSFPLSAPSFASSSNAAFQQHSVPQHHHSSSVSSQTTTTMYPLCTGGWCLTRLRQTCSLWTFVRTGIVDKIWDEEVPTILPVAPPASEKPPVPPRRRGLWGMASALSEKAVSWTEGDKEKAKKTPPPVHPDVVAATAPVKRSLPPPLPPVSSNLPPLNPPPLPKRSEGRSRMKSLPDPIVEGSAVEDAAPISAVNIPLPESRPPTPDALPPPIPRRAAARASMMPNAGSSRPATPPIGSPELAQEKQTEAPTSEKVLEEQEAKALEGQETTVLENQEAIPVAVETPAHEMEEVALNDEPEKVNEVDAAPLVNGHTSDSENVKVEESDDKKLEENEDKEREETDDKEVYVGDTTWEERTWKDLVRLKEDLFWSRVGGLR
ncbi:proline-rich protein [Mycena floridula]|nr:proline-rich protein [Mycena floridula]